MKPIICNCCGGKINQNRMICEFCGTKYRDDSVETLRVETFQRPCETLACRIVVPREQVSHIGADVTSKFVRERFANEFAKSLEEFMDIVQEYDPCTQEYVFTSKVRVLHPNYRF